MTVQTRSQLLTVAETIRDEVATGANTCLRVGGFCVNLLDSLLLEAENAPRATVVATSNITLSGISTTIDGVLCNTADTDVVLCSAQSSADENGPWVVQSGPWTRPAWFPTGGNAGGRLVRVQRGTVYADSSWLCTTDDPNAVIDTDNLTWQRRLDLVSEDGGTMTIGDDSDVNNVEVKTASSGLAVYINTVKTFDTGATGATFANVSDATDYTMIKPSGPYTRITRVTNGGTELKAITLAEDYVEVGEGSNCAHVYATVSSGGDVIFRQVATQFGKWDNAALEVSPAGATVSASGVIRVPQSSGLRGVCASGPTDAPMIEGDNANLNIGDAAWITVVHDSTSGHEFDISGDRLVMITTADLRVYDTADSTQYVAYGHGTIYGSNALDAEFFVGVADATGSDAAQDAVFAAGSLPAGGAAGNLAKTILRPSVAKETASPGYAEGVYVQMWDYSTGGTWEDAIKIYNNVIQYQRLSSFSFKGTDGTAASNPGMSSVLAGGDAYNSSGDNGGGAWVNAGDPDGAGYSGSCGIQFGGAAMYVIRGQEDAGGYKIAVFDSTPVVQQTDPGDFTDNTTGTPSTTLAALPDPGNTPADADALRDDLVTNVLPVLRNWAASLAAQNDAIRLALANYGWIA